MFIYFFIYFYSHHVPQEIIQSSDEPYHLSTIPLKDFHLFKITMSVISFCLKFFYNSVILDKCKFFNEMVDYVTCLSFEHYNFSRPLWVSLSTHSLKLSPLSHLLSKLTLSNSLPTAASPQPAVVADPAHHRLSSPPFADRSPPFTPFAPNRQPFASHPSDDLSPPTPTGDPSCNGYSFFLLS